VLAFATNWPANQTVFVNTITGGAEEIAGMMSQATTGRATSSASIADSLDAAIDEMTDLASNWSRRTPLDAASEAPGAPAPVQSSPAAISAANMLWISAVLFGVGSAGVLVVIKTTLAFLLALGPVFLMLGVFPGTRGLFEGWLRTIVAGSLALAFTLLATAGALAIIAPMIAEIAGEQALGVNNVEPVFALTIACVVFAMLVRQIVATTARLTAAWRLPESGRESAMAERDPAPATIASSALAGDPRIFELVAAVGRQDHGLPARAAVAAALSSASHGGVDDADPRADIRRAPRAYRGFGSSGRRIARGLS
jgi:type IV secretion system protein VirB6